MRVDVTAWIATRAGSEPGALSFFLEEDLVVRTLSFFNDADGSTRVFGGLFFLPELFLGLALGGSGSGRGVSVQETLFFLGGGPKQGVCWQ